jgi:hypothetical protein
LAQLGSFGNFWALFGSLSFLAYFGLFWPILAYFGPFCFLFLGFLWLFGLFLALSCSSWHFVALYGVQHRDRSLSATK